MIQNTNKLLNKVLFLIIFILVVNYLAMTFHWYSSIWFLDMIMHFLGGFWLSLTIIYFLKIDNISKKNILRIVFLSLMIGIFWEIFERVIDLRITANKFDFSDTLSDLIFDLFGALTGLFYLLKK